MRGAVTAEQKSSNKASGNAQVGAQFGFVSGNAHVQGIHSVRPGPGTDIASELAVMIDELKAAVAAAREREELSPSDADFAAAELAAAAELVPAAVRGDTTGLMERLRRVGEVLSKGLKVLAQLAEVVATVKGLT